jgi:hypothetical protein
MPANMCVPATVAGPPARAHRCNGSHQALGRLRPRETFRFTSGEFTEILSSMRDLDGDLLVDDNGDPRLPRRIGKKTNEYMRYWADSALMILLRRLARPSVWVDLEGVLGGSRAALSRIFTHMVNLVWVRYGPLVLLSLPIMVFSPSTIVVCCLL